ncbi:MAG TPA: ABC transporter permease [Gemmatimonadales bacterium]|nr:ABC transporter permease [Gemmatimonadales bacterium]
MTWWSRLWHRRRVEEQLRNELEFHVEGHTADLIARGVDPNEARRRARLEFGGVEQVKEACRDARGARWLEDAARDVRHTFRALRQRPGFSAVAVTTLAIGISTTTIMFTVVHGVLLKPLAFPEPHRLLVVREETSFSTAFGNQWAFAYPNYLDCRNEVRALAMTAWRFSGGTVSGSGVPDYVQGVQVSWDLFSVLGVPLEQGRGFLEDEDRPGGSPVAIISHSFWQRRYGGRADIVGERIVFDGTVHTVIGVVPGGTAFLSNADIVTPLGQAMSARLGERRMHPGIQVWARLRPDASLEEASAQLALVGQRLAEEYPDSNKGRTFVAATAQAQVGSVGSTLWLLFGAVSLVLLVACANVASLLLARAVARHRELAVRGALGASRSRLVRQCLTEAGVLALIGGLCGVGLAAAGLRPFIAQWPGNLPRAAEVSLDWNVVLFASALSLASSLIVGLAPALRAPSRHVDNVLRSGGRTIRGSSRTLHGLFVVSEVALAVILLACAGLLGRTLVRLSSLDPGVNRENVMVARMALSPATLADPARTRASWADLLDRARTVPAVQAAAIVDTVPMRQGNNQLPYWNSATLPPADERPLALATAVSPDYLTVMGMVLRAGRFVEARDGLTTPPVVVIDDVLARQAFGADDPVGKPLWIPDLAPGPIEVIGVVGHVRHWGLAGDDQAEIRAQFYYPFAQVPDQLVRRWSELMSIAVRTSVDPLAVVEPLRYELRGVSGDQVLYEIRTLDQLASNSLAGARFLLVLFSVFAGVALLLACIGIYGVLSFLTTERVPEIGTRMAMGATAAQVMQLVLGQSLRLIAIGIAVGTLGAQAASSLLVRLVEGVHAIEPSTLATIVAVLAASALLATYLPARRASQVDAMTALRSE